MMKVEITGTKNFQYHAVIEQIVADFCRVFGLTRNEDILEINFVSSAKIRQLNSRFLGKDYATDVLSFPQSDSPARRKIYGTIVISKTIALKKNIKIEELVKHGLLHLKGFDHEKNQSQWRTAALKINHQMF